jgi:hypothetical protein
MRWIPTTAGSVARNCTRKRLAIRPPVISGGMGGGKLFAPTTLLTSWNPIIAGKAKARNNWN